MAKQQYRSVTNSLGVVFLLVTVAACGFQIRGAADVPLAMQKTYLAADDRHSPFYQRLRDQFQIVGVDLVESPTDATAVFSILSDETDQRVLAVSARNVPREYEVYYIVSYSLQSGQVMLMEPRTQTQVRDYTWDETEVLGKSREEQLLRDAIVEDLVRVVMIQLTAL